jgi:hypothetical protein
VLFPFDGACLLPYEEVALLPLLLDMKISYSSSLDSAHEKGHFVSSSLSTSFLGICFLYLEFNLRSPWHIYFREGATMHPLSWLSSYMPRKNLTRLYEVGDTTEEFLT